MKRISPVALALILMLAGCAAPTAAVPAELEAFSASGIIDVPNIFRGAGVGAVGQGCEAREGYEDVSAGAQIVVKDSNGKTVSVGRLEAGKTVMKVITSTFSSPKCGFKFQIKELPGGEKFFSVHIGNVSRGDVQFTRSELEAGAELSIG